jgi:hypothetical protein
VDAGCSAPRVYVRQEHGAAEIGLQINHGGK